MKVFIFYHTFPQELRKVYRFGLGNTPGLLKGIKTYLISNNNLSSRFANTITGQFNGHTHKDEFQVYYNSSEVTQPVGVAFNGASVTPFSSSNPSYKLYKVDSTTFVSFNIRKCL